MKIAIAQLNPTIGDLQGNADKILKAADRAAAEGVRLLLTPELSLCGYPPRDLLLDPNFVETMARQLAELASSLPEGVAVLVGTVEPNAKAISTGGKPLFNSVALIEKGNILKIFHKRLLPTYDVFDEDRYFEPGNQPNHFELDGVHIGVTICEDLWNDEEFWGKRTYNLNPIADLAASGVNFTINLSASPYTVGKQKLREAMLRHGAVRFNQPLIYANQVGGNDDLIFDGASIAIDKSGELIARAISFDEDWLVIEYNGQDFEKSSVAPAPDCEEAELWSALVLGVRDYARKCGFSKIVLGLSGGIDSSLIAAIASEAVGKENVLGILMPSPYSSDHSIQDALDLAQNLGIQTQTLPIGTVMECFDRTLDPLFAGTPFGLAEENLQSRIRGTLLMAVSNKFGHLLVSTGNKSEIAVGYCTLYGDMNGGLAAIADVPKTKVYKLCEWINRSQEIIPTNVLIKPPSAELKPGQKDQDSLPDYEVLDDILDRYIHQHQSPAEIVAAGHESAIVDRVVKLVRISEFKRKQAPPGLKVTDRAFGTGWRMPIASRWIARI
ncbi:NAD+ synthase [Leptolyngbya sp. NIES-2104]|uniref:NAD+ synthase n=1 Tax=Leptolyngbya sp. NIES-2104 TaxID=1552121 RepID=UPI0006EC4C42|nr:NAD+ synthase [Leptolyngbya sp. NIES-2104]GAP94393.1 NAD synthetase / Glutamine amidotransferase chain of NAD synthetase [Leptolyngbya sp. NIES-2104]